MSEEAERIYQLMQQTTPHQNSATLAVFEACKKQYADGDMALAAMVGFCTGLAYVNSMLAAMVDVAPSTAATPSNSTHRTTEEKS